jgi:hypothetical protein
MATVNITISEESGGFSAADTLDMGSLTPETPSSFQDLFISHDAEVNPITDCNLYITEYTGSSYEGDNTAEDLDTILGWGDAGPGVYGALYSMTRPGSWVIGTEFPTDWSSFSNSSGTVNSQIELLATSLVYNPSAADGTIPVGDEAHIQVKINAPAASVGAGHMAFGLVFSYSATS